MLNFRNLFSRSCHQINFFSFATIIYNPEPAGCRRRIFCLNSKHLLGPNPGRTATIYFTAKYRFDPIESEADEI